MLRQKIACMGFIRVVQIDIECRSREESRIKQGESLDCDEISAKASTNHRDVSNCLASDSGFWFG